jgi:eukaryotic-like serine/threonine-protein kinase
MAVAISADEANLQPLVISVPTRRTVRPKKRRRPATLVVGQKIGSWRVEGELGRGGMATVYAVSHVRFGKRAALKLAHREALGEKLTPETFLREARIVHLVDHPGVGDVFATGTFDGRPYLVMERLAGATLGQLRDARRLSRADALAILVELCDAIAAAHAAGVIHRDLKLDNVFIQAVPGGTGRRVKLLDWGVARIVAEPDPLRGMLAGTLSYLAPEQVAEAELTPAADIYSLGVLAYQLLLGTLPFAAATDLELIKHHVHTTPPAPSKLWPEIPAELAYTMTAMLAKDPLRRPRLAEVQQAFARAIAPLDVRVVETEPEPPRRPVLAAAAVSVAAAALGVLTLAIAAS